MNDDRRFDPARSDAVRQLLIETVELTPRRSRRRHIRIAVAAVLAALVGGVGTAAVAFAVTGGTFETVQSAPVVTDTMAPSLASTPSPKPSATPAAPDHPVVATDAAIEPHDVLTAPTQPKWVLDLPGWSDPCALGLPIDVSDGFALVQRGPQHTGDAGAEGCDLSESRLALSLVDTSTGRLVWDREWSWPFDEGDATEVRLLGSSGRVMVWDDHGGLGPKEVLDLASGTTLGQIVGRDDLAYDRLSPIPGPDGHVSFLTREKDASGAATGGWSVQRADPLTLTEPVWSRPLSGTHANSPGIGNLGSVLWVDHGADGQYLTDVLDIDTGAVMAVDTTDRSYLYRGDLTLRESSFNPLTLPRTVAGIDDAGNEIWSRTLESGYRVFQVAESGIRPGTYWTSEGTDVVLAGPGNRIEYIDGLTGTTLWSADASACATSFNSGNGPISLDMRLAPDGVVVEYDMANPGTAVCGFDRSTGAAVDVGGRRQGTQAGDLASYTTLGGLHDGPDPTPGAATGSAYDAVTGAELWTIPKGDNEWWSFAGGYLVGISGSRLTGIG